MDNKLKHGTVVVTYPSNITLPERAGQLTAAEITRLPKARRGIGLACDATAAVLEKHGDRVPGAGVDPADLVKAGKMAEDIDHVIADMEHALMIMKQANLLLDGDAHTRLRKVLAAVRAAEKFDPRVGDLFRHLNDYFANTRGGGEEGGAPPGGGAPPA